MILIVCIVAVVSAQPEPCDQQAYGSNPCVQCTMTESCGWCTSASGVKCIAGDESANNGTVCDLASWTYLMSLCANPPSPPAAPAKAYDVEMILAFIAAGVVVAAILVGFVWYFSTREDTPLSSNFVFRGESMTELGDSMDANRARLAAIYKKYNPSKIGDIDATLGRWTGREDLMFEKLRKKYGPEPNH